MAGVEAGVEAAQSVYLGLSLSLFGSDVGVAVVAIMSL